MQAKSSLHLQHVKIKEYKRMESKKIYINNKIKIKNKINKYIKKKIINNKKYTKTK